MRIAGVTIPEDKKLFVSLTHVYGVGKSRALKVLGDAKIDPHKKSGDLSEAEQGKLREALDAYKVEGDLKREVSANIKRLKDVESYRGKRHETSLPMRGQKTRTNTRTVPSGLGAKTRKRVTMGSGRVKVEKK